MIPPSFPPTRRAKAPLRRDGGRTDFVLDGEPGTMCRANFRLSLPDEVCGVRWHDIAFSRRDMSRRTTSADVSAHSKPHWRGRNLDGRFLPNAATPKRTCLSRQSETAADRALLAASKQSGRNSQFAIRNCQGFFSGFHFGMDDWGIWRLNLVARRKKHWLVGEIENSFIKLS